MSTREEMFRAVCESPEDDAVRLIYADWLDEQGDPQAEFIRLQIRLAGLAKDDPERVMLELREGELLRQNFDRFRPPRLTGVVWGEFYKGFVDRARFAGYDGFVRSAAAAFASAPLRSIAIARGSVPSTDPRLVQLIEDFAPLSRLTEIDRWGLEGDQSLLISPRLTGLVRLRAYGCGLRDEHLRALANGPPRPRMRELELGNNQFGPEGLAALADSRSFPALERLTLESNRLRGYVGPLGDFAASLVSLDLTGTGHDDQSLATLMRGRAVAKLAELRVSSNSIGDPGVATIAQSPCAATLRELHLANNDMGPEGARALAGVGWPALEVLMLVRNRLGAAGVEAMAHSSGFPRLRQLALGTNELGDAGATALARQTGLSSVTSLDLERNGIGPAGAAALAETDRLDHVETLALMSNPIGAEGALAMAAGAGLTGLVSLRLGRAGVGTRAIRAQRALKNRFGGRCLT